ncbi:hypothetical protein J2X58_002294 [Luteibacter sp. 3190]|nr:hypothetical protein [Luteibacter sp. 3190]
MPPRLSSACWWMRPGDSRTRWLERTWPRRLWGRAEQVLWPCREEPSRPGPLPQAAVVLLWERTWPRRLWGRAEQVLWPCREERRGRVRSHRRLSCCRGSGPGRDAFGAGRNRSCGLVAKSRRGRVRCHRRLSCCCGSGPGRDAFGAGRNRSCGLVAKSRRGRVRSHRRLSCCRGSGPGRDAFGAGRDRSCGFVAKSRRGRVRSHRRLSCCCGSGPGRDAFGAGRDRTCGLVAKSVAAGSAPTGGCRAVVGADLAAMPLEPGGTGPVALSRRASRPGPLPQPAVVLLWERTWPRRLWGRAGQVLWPCREEPSRPGPLQQAGLRERKSPRPARAFDSARFLAAQNGISSSSKPSLAGGAERCGALPPRGWP